MFMKNNVVDQHTKMTKTPIPKLVTMMAIPTTISMLITNIYNTADTYFVSQISISASGATSVVLSIMSIIQAFGFMFGHGAGSLISRQLGSKNKDKASTLASTSFFSALFLAIFISIMSFIAMEPLLMFLGSTESMLLEAKTYALFILLAAPAMMTSCVCNNILRYEGRAVFATIGLGTGGILNMILDPLFIFVFKMNIAGAGLATMLSQYITVMILLVPYIQGKTDSKISFKNVSKEFKDYTNIIITGLPNLARNSFASISTTILNNQCRIYGDAAIAAMGVVNKVGNLLFCLATGICQGFQPVSAYNYGAKNYKRVKQSAIFTVFAGTLIVGVLSVVCMMNAEFVISLFRSEPEILKIGGQALRYLCCTKFLLPMSFAGSMLFQCTGQKQKAFFLAAIQSGLVYIPLIWVLPNIYGLFGIEIAQPISYIISFMISLPMILIFFKELNEKEEVESYSKDRVSA